MLRSFVSDATQRAFDEYDQQIRDYGAAHHTFAQLVRRHDGTYTAPADERHLFYDNGVLDGWFYGRRWDLPFPWRIVTRAGILIVTDTMLWLPMPNELRGGPIQ